MSFLREWKKNKYLCQISKPLLSYIKCGIIILTKICIMGKYEKAMSTERFMDWLVLGLMFPCIIILITCIVAQISVL